MRIATKDRLLWQAITTAIGKSIWGCHMERGFLLAPITMKRWRQKLFVRLFALPVLLGFTFTARAASAPDVWALWLYGATSALYNPVIPASVDYLKWDVMTSPSFSANWHEGGSWLGFWVVTGGYYGTQTATYAGTPANKYSSVPIYDNTGYVIGFSDYWYCEQATTPSCTGGNSFEVTDFWSGGSAYWRTYIP